VRTFVGVALVTVCLGLAGCSLFGKKQAAHNNNSNPKPFTGAEAPAKTETVAVPAPAGGPLPGANGLLAGQIVAASTGKPVKGVIEVKDLEEEDPKLAKIEKEIPEDGYFTIPQLKVGGHYKLIARANEGGEVISQTQFVVPPKPNLFFQLSKRNTTPSTPPIPDPPKPPDKKGTSGTESSRDGTSTTTLDPPVKIDPGKGPPSSREGESTPPPDNGMGASGNSGNISNIAQEFPRTTVPRPQTADVTIPNHQSAPWPPQAPEPQWESIPDERRPQPTPPATPPKSPGSVRLPDVPTRNPSCELYGDKLENFALRDERGQPWEYARDCRGGLLLLDFWATTCTHCVMAIHRLADLQRVYGPYGLKVVGIAYETGKIQEQQAKVLKARNHYSINYKTLLSGGGFEYCEVAKQFQIKQFPTLVLIDASGKILWKSEGLDDYAHATLKKLIESKLLATRSSP
jgi:thiol-disulfide isomerase/thioredoxin